MVFGASIFVDCFCETDRFLSIRSVLFDNCALQQNGMAMTGNSDVDIDSEAALTVQIVGAAILTRALESLLKSFTDLAVVEDDGHVILLVGAEGQNQLRHGRHMSKRRRRERFALLTNAQDIDYRLVREAPIEVFIGNDESFATLLQGLNAASLGEAFCSQQLVPALIAAAVSSASADERGMSNPTGPESRRTGADRVPKRQPLSRKLAPDDNETELQESPADTSRTADDASGDEESLINQEKRTLHLAVALGLSEREAEVAIEAVKGFSNTEIAELLSMSVATIKYHLYQAYQKLGIHRRSQLAAALFLPSSDE